MQTCSFSMLEMPCWLAEKKPCLLSTRKLLLFVKGSICSFKRDFLGILHAHEFELSRLQVFYCIPLFTRYAQTGMKIISGSVTNIVLKAMAVKIDALGKKSKFHTVMVKDLRKNISAKFWLYKLVGMFFLRQLTIGIRNFIFLRLLPFLCAAQSIITFIKMFLFGK